MQNKSKGNYTKTELTNNNNEHIMLTSKLTFTCTADSSIDPSPNRVHRFSRGAQVPTTHNYNVICLMLYNINNQKIYTIFVSNE